VALRMAMLKKSSRTPRTPNATIRCVAAGRRGALNSYRGIRVRVGAIFDVRALLMPPLALSA
jgi:hypothetical protein